MSDSKQALDESALARHLASQIAGFNGPVTLARFEGGQSNPTYRLETPTQTLVMRTKPAPVAKLLPSAHAIEREFRVMQAFHGSGVPVPRMMHLCLDESVIGVAFYVMEHVQGRVFWDPTLPGMSRSQRGAIYDELARVLAALHQVDPQVVGLADYGKAGNYFARQIDRWSRQYRACITEPIQAMDRLMDWLPHHLPASAQLWDKPRVAHGDFRLDNLIFHPTEPVVLGVLDWELSTLGHPLADLSYLCMGWHIKAEDFRGMAGVDVAQLGIPTESQFIRSYLARTGSDAYDVLMQDWNYYLSYNLFRMAAILQGIGKRLQEGIAASAQAPRMAAGAKPLAELAWQFACAHGENRANDRLQ